MSTHLASSAELFDKTDLNLANKFASEGLRVLAFSTRDVPESLSVKEAGADLIETDLKLVGITAVEDLLQDDVSKCIEEFRLAGIKVWMLTGDKGETAMEIGLRCGLYEKDTMTMFQVVESTVERDLLADLNRFVETIETQSVHSEARKKFAMAVAGKCLPVIYESRELSDLIK